MITNTFAKPLRGASGGGCVRDIVLAAFTATQDDPCRHSAFDVSYTLSNSIWCLQLGMQVVL